MLQAILGKSVISHVLEENIAMIVSQDTLSALLL